MLETLTAPPEARPDRTADHLAAVESEVWSLPEAITHLRDLMDARLETV
ncbi:MAG: hypothetical protein OXU68_14200 [Bacteroidota bacterium]|nr:hypothetical protein [Bacteroidota bacterium]